MHCALTASFVQKCLVGICFVHVLWSQVILSQKDPDGLFTQRSSSLMYLSVILLGDTAQKICG